MSNLPFDVNQLIKICRSAGVLQIGIFGSMARGDWNAESDIDVLIKLPESVGLLKFIQLKTQLSDALGRNVDLVTEGGISPYLYEAIMREMIFIYNQED
jgi:uncharacterized protein